MIHRGNLLLTHPDEFDWISHPVKRERERNASEAGFAQGFAEGIDLVLAEPASYSLRTTSERLDYIARSYSSGYAEGNTSGIAHVYENRLSYGLSGDPERDERIQEAGELGYSVGEAAGRAEAIATAQADLFDRVCILWNISRKWLQPLIPRAGITNRVRVGFGRINLLFLISIFPPPEATKPAGSIMIRAGPNFPSTTTNSRHGRRSNHEVDMERKLLIGMVLSIILFPNYPSGP